MKLPSHSKLIRLHPTLLIISCYKIALEVENKVMYAKTELVFCGVVLDKKIENQGSASIAADLGQDIIDFFLETSVYRRIEIPEQYVFKSGEIFYSNNKIVEFRLTLAAIESFGAANAAETICVTKNKPLARFAEIKSTAAVTDFYADLDKNFSDKNKGKQVPSSSSDPKKSPKRLTPVIPNVTAAKSADIKYVPAITNELQTALEDHPRSYLTAEIAGDQLYFRWNLSPVENVENVSDKPGRVQGVVFKCLYPILGFIRISPSDLPNSLNISLRKLLSEPSVLINEFQDEPSGKQINIKTGAAQITYSYEKAAVLQSLLNAFSDISDVPAEAIQKIIEKHKCSEEKANYMYFFEILRARSDFISEAFYIEYEEFATKWLEFTLSVLTELYAENVALRFTPHEAVSIRDRERELKALSVKVQKRVNELFLFKPGRRLGSANVVSLAKEKIENAAKTARIRAAIKIVCQDKIKQFGGLDFESKVNRGAVAKRLHISRKTLSNWIDGCGFDFESERNKALRNS